MDTDAQHPLSSPLGKSPARRRLEAAAEIGLIFAVFFIHAGWPVPEVNETHYLAKAKHYWNPDWCARDFFLATADAHQVFYWTCGWITRWLSLPATAWVGRIVTWGLLAWAWRRLSVAIVPLPLYSVLSAALFLAATSRLHLAGEWIIGGFEAKGLAYVFVLLALEAVARNRWRLVWPLLGAASAFHVVIGAWSVLAAGVAWLGAGKDRASVRSMLAPLMLGLALSLPGLVPALALTRGVEPGIVREANRIYVFERLPHHLSPQAFPLENLRRQFLLWVLWIVLCFVVPKNCAERRVRWMVATAIGIALVGFALAPLANYNVATAAAILRYYWFRMSDIFVPLGVALLATLFIVDRRIHAPRMGNLWLVVAMLAAGGHLASIANQRRENPIPPADRKMADERSWREICDWVSKNTPSDALFITPRSAQSFRWYTGRAEVVGSKDIPQDAAGIVQWWRRVNDVYRERRSGIKPGWYRSLTDETPARLLELGEKYGADYVITDVEPRIGLELVSPRNSFYAVYRLPRRP